MRSASEVLILILVALPVFAGKPSEAERKELEAWAKSLDRDSIHKAVLDHERNPLGSDTRKIRPVLSVHFEAVDYVVCLDQIGPLLDAKNHALEAVFWQIVFGSGDFVEQHPDQAKDKLAYMLAGLESGLRSYEVVLREKPKAHHVLLDKLLSLRKEGRLVDFVNEHPCDQK